MPKIRYSEWVAISAEITKLRLKIVSQFKEFNAAQDAFKGATDLKGAGWDSGRSYFDGYKEVSEAIFNALYTVDDIAKNYVSAFTAEVGPAENDLDTDRMEELQAELRHLQAQNNFLMEAAAKAFEDIPFINKFFLNQSMLGAAKKIEILEKYQAFEAGHGGDFQEVQAVITSITQGLAMLGNAGNFIGGKEGFKPIAWKDQEWLKKLQAYNKEHGGDRYEVVVVHEDHDGKTFAVYKNGKLDRDRTVDYNKMLGREAWELLMELGPEVLKALIGLDDVEVLLDGDSSTGERVKASIFLLLAVTPADKVKDIIKAAKGLKKGENLLDGVKLTGKQLEMLKDLDKTRDITKIFEKGKNILKNFDLKNAYVKPKHLASTGGKGAKFLGDSKEGAELVLKKTMSEGKVLSITDNGLTAKGNSSYEIIIEASEAIGTKGQSKLKIILSDDGGMLSAYPIN